MVIETFVVKTIMHGEEGFAPSGPAVSVFQVMLRCAKRGVVQQTQCGRGRAPLAVFTRD